MKKLASCLWFAKGGEKAARFYCSVFKGKMGTIMRHEKGGTGKPGTVLYGEFEILGQAFQFINGGPMYKISPAVSFSISCKDQAEVDYYWSRLTKGGKAVACGWLEDKFGVSWQVVPAELMRLHKHKDAGVRSRVMGAMMGMVKLDVATLRRAAMAGRTVKKL